MAEKTPVYTVENLSEEQIKQMLPPGAQAAKVTPEQAAQLGAQAGPELKAALDAAFKQAAQIPQNPNHDKVTTPNDAVNMAADEFSKLPFSERNRIRREANKVIGRKFYQIWEFDIGSQTDWAMVLLGVCVGVIVTTLGIYIIGYFRKA